MTAEEAALAAAIDAALTTTTVTYRRPDATYPPRTRYGTWYHVVVCPGTLHVPVAPAPAAGAPPGAAVLRGGDDLDTPAH